MNYYLLLSLSKLAQHFNHDWGSWFQDQTLKPYMADYASIEEVQAAWIAHHQAAETDPQWIGLGPCLSHFTGSGRYSWIANVELSTLTIEVNRAAEHDPAENDIVARAVIKYGADDWRGEIIKLELSNRAEQRHVGFLLEMLIAVHDAHSASRLFCKLLEVKPVHQDNLSFI